MSSWVAIGAALIVGVTLGLLGGGGSILTVPTMVYLLHIAPKAAMAMALVVVAATSAAAATLHARARHVRWDVAWPFALAGVPGAFLGGRLSKRVPDKVLLVAFALFMIAAAVALLRRREAEPTARAPAPVSARVLGIMGCGALVGVMTGVLGAGGGFLIVPALVSLAGLPMREAIGTSLVVIAVNATTGLVARADPSLIQVQLTAIFSVIAIAGAVVGHRVGRRLHVDLLRRMFAVVVLLVACYIIVKSL